MNLSSPIAVSKWMWCLCPCQARVQVEDKNAILDVGVWTDKTRKNDASSPSNTEMRYVVLMPSLPCEPIVRKTMAPMGIVSGKI